MNNQLNNNNYKLYKLIFKNIVLSNIIYNYCRLYNKNEIVTFESRNQLLEYEEKEYIQSLIYNGKESLNVGDLPINCELRRIVFAENVGIIKEHVIPYGVEILEYSKNQKSNTPFSQLPTSIHTIRNAIVIYPNEIDIERHNQRLKTLPNLEIQDIKLKLSQHVNEIKTLRNEYTARFEITPNDITLKEERIKTINILKCKTNEITEQISFQKDKIKLSTYENCKMIPSNIKSISFLECQDISSDINNINKLILPNTINELIFDINVESETNNWLPLKFGDIPNSVTSLSIYSILSSKFQNDSVLPLSIKELKISKMYSALDGYFNFLIPMNNIETLTLNGCKITKESGLHKCKSIKTLIINLEPVLYFVDSIGTDSLPSSITNLTISNLNNITQIEKNSIPNSVIKLDFSNNNNNDHIDYSLIDLPPSITNLILPINDKIKNNKTF